MVWISILALTVATGATIIGYCVFRSQVDPEVIVYVVLDRRRPTIILLVIENIGRGAARNVRFTLARPIPKRAFGIKEKDIRPFEPMDDGPLVTGIPFLEPGGKRKLTWGQYGGLNEHLGDDGASITVEYEHRHHGWPWPLKARATFPLEIVSFAASDISDGNWDKKAANHLGDICVTLKGMLQLMKAERHANERERPQTEGDRRSAESETNDV